MRKTRKKAVSPVIATLLLILIAVAAAILVYVWVTGYASSMTKTGTPELEEKIKVEAVNYVNSTKKVTVYFRNIGSVKAVVDSVYVIRARDNAILTSATGISVSLTPGQVSSYEVTLTDYLEQGQTYIVKVVTKNGVEASLSFTVRAT